MHDFRIGCVGSGGERTVSKHGCEGGEGGYFDVELDFVEGVAVGGVARSEAVVGEGVVG